MKDDQTVAELIRKHAELSARISACHAEQARLLKLMTALREVLLIYRPDMVFEPFNKRQAPNRARGENANAVLDVLRTAERPLTTREIAERVLVGRGGPNPEPHIVRRIIPTIAVTLRRNAQKGLLDDGGGSPARWRLMQPSPAEPALTKKSG